MSKVKSLPPRSSVKTADTWNLSSLFESDADWEKAFAQWEKRIAGFKKFDGHLADDAKTLASCLKFDADFDRAGERLGNYAFLKTAEDQGNSDYQRMQGRFQHAATKAGEAASFIRPQIIAIPDKKMQAFLKSPQLAQWKLALERILRYRPHTLSASEENLLAMQGQMSEASNQIFRQLNDADLKWPALKNEAGQLVELSHSSFSAFLYSPSREGAQERV